jgi:hypothetical protein
MFGHINWSSMSDGNSARKTHAVTSAPIYRLSDALAELLKAYEYAGDTHRGVWDFAVEASLLRQIGLTHSDFRWLTCKGYVQHARDVTESDSTARNFVPDAELAFTKRSCFVLTADGAAFARHLLYGDAEHNGVPTLKLLHEERVSSTPATPTWDANLHELTVGPVLVKRFKWPAVNQETLLSAFQEEGWPPRIDDPLPPQPEQDSKRRLHDTIKSLNRNQRQRLLRFKGDGTGEGARWEFFPRADRVIDFRPAVP